MYFSKVNFDEAFASFYLSASLSMYHLFETVILLNLFRLGDQRYKTWIDHCRADSKRRKPSKATKKAKIGWKGDGVHVSGFAQHMYAYITFTDYLEKGQSVNTALLIRLNDG